MCTEPSSSKLGEQDAIEKQGISWPRLPALKLIFEESCKLNETESQGEKWQKSILDSRYRKYRHPKACSRNCIKDIKARKK